MSAIATAAAEAGTGAPTFEIRFVNPAERLRGERKSKLLDPTSPLHQWIMTARARLTAAGAKTDAGREPHIEVLNDKERDDTAAAARRATSLHNTTVPLVISKLGKALVINTGEVEGYGMTHVTVAFFPEGLTAEQVADYTRLLLSSA